MMVLLSILNINTKTKGKLAQCKDLIKIPLSQYHVLNDEGLQGVKAYRSKYNVFAEQGTVIILLK